MLILFFGLLLNACSKSGSSTITGKWNIASDSTIISGGTDSYNIYHGAIGDYFVFAPNGILYTKEASLYDTIAYKLEPNDKIILPKIGFSLNGVTEPSSISLTRNKLRIIANPPGNVINPGLHYQRIINLMR